MARTLERCQTLLQDLYNLHRLERYHTSTSCTSAKCATYPMQLVAMDIVGQFPESESGSKYILVVSDYYTKWVEAYGIANQEASTIAQILLDEFFCHFSPPQQLHSDQRRQFESQVIAQICKLLGIVKSHTSSYHSQSDGQDERFNRTLLDMLATSAKDQPWYWEHHLQKVCFAYNTPQPGSLLSICFLGDKLSYLWTLCSPQPRRV